MLGEHLENEVLGCELLLRFFGERWKHFVPDAFLLLFDEGWKHLKNEILDSGFSLLGFGESWKHFVPHTLWLSSFGLREEEWALRHLVFWCWGFTFLQGSLESAGHLWEDVGLGHFLKCFDIN